MSRLQHAIEQLYIAFNDVRKPHHIEGCSHCLDDEDINILLTTPLRELSSEEVASYASSAFLTVGGVDDYLYFLPRILEITATEDEWYPMPEITGRAIASSQVDSWPAHRRSALDSYFITKFESMMESANYEELDAWLCMAGRIGLDVRPYLKQIEQSPQAVLAVFEDNVNTLPLNKLSNGFWELPNTAHDVILAWLRSDEVQAIPRESYGYQLPPLQ